MVQAECEVRRSPGNAVGTSLSFSKLIVQFTSQKGDRVRFRLPGFNEKFPFLAIIKKRRESRHKFAHRILRSRW